MNENDSRLISITILLASQERERRKRNIKREEIRNGSKAKVRKTEA